MEVKTRVFAYDGREMPDPDQSLTVDEVKKSLAAFFPELATADAREQADDARPGVTIWEFVRKTGTKGIYDPLTPIMVVAALKNVREFHLDLIDLAWRCAGEDGELDERLLNLNRKEIDAAADQAASYVKGVRRALGRILSFRENSRVVNN